MHSKITIWEGSNCVMCTAVKKYFAKVGVEIRNLDNAPEIVDKAVQMGIRSKPVIVHELGNDVKFYGGFNPPEHDKMIAEHLAAKEDE